MTGKELCAALGLTGRRVTRLVITAELGEPVTVQVTELIGDGSVLADVLTTYRLEELEQCTPRIG